MDIEEKTQQAALGFLFGMGAIRISALLSKLDDVSEVFTLSLKALKSKTGIAEKQLASMEREKALRLAIHEMQACEKLGIEPLFFLDEKYPRRLLQCADAPVVIYVKGPLDLNERRVVSIVGTRKNTDYANEIIQSFTEEIKQPGLIIVSGLALGVDTLVHKSALKNNIPTLGVLGNGLNKIYPSRNTSLAREMIDQGGALLSEYPVDSLPNREHFPMRNRIVAGMADAVVVVESQEKGGSIITAELANDYNRDVFAFPGSVRQMYSSGCNMLIRRQKAHLITNASEFLTLMNWADAPKPLQKSLAIEYSPEEKEIVDCLSKYECLHLDQMVQKIGFSPSKIQALTFSLLLKNGIVSLPGNRYSI
jgi:DNA processing protein